jgi:maltooligosyltrehalose trehalohydrolase
MSKTLRDPTTIPLGATIQDGGVHFAVWAPAATSVEVEVHGEDGLTHHPLVSGAQGLREGLIPELAAGSRYKYRLDGGQSYPDPASRFQPEGVHGPSEVIDPLAFRWSDGTWPGVMIDDLIVYELHVGAYTPRGTFAALIDQLPELTRLGITALELMPVADFPGRWNWGYDGVDWWAPSRAYGRPEDLRRLVDAAHRHGLGVILDVVYNHFGPDGAYWRAFSEDYFTDRHKTPWGDAINYDGANSRWVREFVLQNAAHWVREYHIDGLRLDATHAIIDDSPTHLLADLADRVRATAAPRQVVLIVEDERNDVRLIRPRGEGGYGLDAVWADDFHHAVRVFLTGEREGYYANYAGSTEEIAQGVVDGFIFQGQVSPRTGEPRGTRVTDEPGSAFVFCTQNHDQVGNRPFGERLNHQIDAGRSAAATALVLFAPETPMLFMGEEFAASTPFLFFTDFDPELGQLVTEGRRAEFAAFRAFADPDMRDSIPDPQAESTFLASKLDLDERRTNAPTYRLYQELLALRRGDPVLSTCDRMATRAFAIGARIVVVHRWQGTAHRLLVANFGAATSLPLADTPELDAMAGADWRLLLSTADRQFGGSGREAGLCGGERGRRLTVPARSAAIFKVDVAVAERFSDRKRQDGKEAVAMRDASNLGSRRRI